MLPRIQGSLQRTKTLILGQVRDLREFIGALYEGEYAVTHWKIFKIYWTLSGR